MVDEKTVEAVAAALEPKCRSFTGGANQLAKVVARELAITALQALSPGSTGEAEGWRDIESAPKDGTRILLWDGAYCRTASWSDDYYTLQNGWLECSGAEGWQSWVSEVLAPTHWRPLPEPPSALLSAAGER